MTAPTFEPERIVAALNAAGVAYVIVGGIAVAAHGGVRRAVGTSRLAQPLSASARAIRIGMRAR